MTFFQQKPSNIEINISEDSAFIYEHKFIADAQKQQNVHRYVEYDDVYRLVDNLTSYRREDVYYNNLVIPENVRDKFLGIKELGEHIDAVSAFKTVSTGYIGNYKGIDIYTDAYRGEEYYKVLNSDHVFLFSSDTNFPFLQDMFYMFFLFPHIDEVLKTWPSVSYENFTYNNILEKITSFYIKSERG